MNDDLFKPIPQRGSREETPENRRIFEIADELHRRCLLYEAKLRNGQDTYVSNDIIYKVNNLLNSGSILKLIETYMAAIGFQKVNSEGRFINDSYEVWDLVPRNVLKDADGDLYVIDAEIKSINK